MQEALLFIFRTLFELYIITFLLRLIVQWVRAEPRNPLVQFILRITNPLVLPLRRWVPPVGGLDTATLLIALALQLAMTGVLAAIACQGMPALLTLLLPAVMRLVELGLQITFFVVLIYVILSWVSPGQYNPATALLASVAEPVLAPLRRLIPPLGGLDLSPLFALIAIQALIILVPDAGFGGIACAPPARTF